MPCTRAHQTPIEDLLGRPDSPECVEFLAHAESCPECAAALTAHRTQGSSTGSIGLWLGLIAGSLLVAALFLWPDDRALQRTDVPIQDSSASRTATPAVDRSPATGVAAADVAVAELVSGTHQVLALRDLPADQPLRLSLRLAEASASAEDRPVRVMSTLGEVVEISGTLVEDRTAATIEVPRSFIQKPGRYMIEVKTTEKSHFPIRRYVVELQ
jgi:hypothetical protein